MALLLDTHLHTKRHSACSRIDEARLIAQAAGVGLDGLVITEHHYQWSDEELRELTDASDTPGFVVLAGFEYTSSCGDILIYGLTPEQVDEFKPGGDPDAALGRAHDLGAVCIAAHPTRAGLGFDQRLANMPFDGLEIASVNLQSHEQRLAQKLAVALNLRPTCASDAHRIEDVGRYAMEFDAVIHCMADFCRAIRAGRFRPAAPSSAGKARA